jgi:hypothetical protein
MENTSFASKMPFADERLPPRDLKSSVRRWEQVTPAIAAVE